MSDSRPPAIPVASELLTAVPAEPGPPPESDALTLSFDGKTSDYFRVWFTTLLLVFVTAGVYWPWAVIRCQRFIGEHTWLGTTPFEYRGRPLAVSRMLLITSVLPAAWLYLATRYQVVGPFMFALWALAWPWLIAFETRFHARCTWYAGRQLDVSLRYSHVLNALLLPFGLCFLCVLPLAIVRPHSFALGLGVWFVVALVTLLLSGVAAFADVRLFNTVCRSARLGSLRCVPDYGVRDAVWILWHGLAASLTYSLLAPWAEICVHRRRLSCLRVVATDAVPAAAPPLNLDRTWA
jgi:uncharacterized membrane protein YjgN (DUF898 family)